MIEERSNVLFIDKFRTLDLNQDQTNDNVFRIHGVGEASKADLVLDIYRPFLNLTTNSVFKFVLMEIDENDNEVEEDKQKDKLFKRYNYVMTGKVFKKEKKNLNDVDFVSIYASFGGLMIRLQADSDLVNHFSIDQEVYLLIKLKSN